MFRYGITIFISAFLLFQVQPLFGRLILPWFGGSSATWTTCLLCFQALLLAGYSYAHFSVTRLTPRQQRNVHVGLLVLGLIFLPIIPSEAWQPTGLESPALRILGVLVFTVGVPYLILSTTTPLMQAWFVREMPGVSPYRFYALSNLGSLLGLLSYPFVVEPSLTLRVQAYLWSTLFVVFAGLASWCAWRAAARSVAPARETEAAVSPPVEPPALFDRALWLVLPMCGSVMLLATTNEMSQDVAAVPFLWVLPLSLYLVSFTITFDSPRWYWRPLWAVLLPICVAGAFMAMKLGVDLPLRLQVGVYCAAVLACCMVLHGELARLKPHHEWLTEFFLTISAGGALGSAIVTLVAPRLLNAFYEFPIALMASCFLFALVLYRQVHRETPTSLARVHVLILVLLAIAGVALLRRFGATYLVAFNDYGRETFAPRVESIEWLSGTVKQRIVSSVDQTWQMAGFALMCVLLPIMVWRRKRGAPTDWISVTAAATVALVSGMIGAHMVIAAEPADAVSSSRNFFGILRVSESAAEDPRTRTLTNGHITHGVQRLDDAGRRRPTTYYSEESGVGVAINTLRRLKGDGKAGMRIGVVGLGAGTLAAYGIDGDVIRFYEINADVLRLNRQHFTFLKDTPARVDVSLGDARIIMERERTGQHPQQFDVIAVDAFSGDAVPLHLLTREAFATYFYHLAPDGVLAMHVSNRYLNLASLVHDLAEDSGRPAIRIQNVQDLEQTIYASTWVLVTSNKAFLTDQLVQDHTTLWEESPGRPKLVFTDDYANIFRILRRPENPDDE
jgi:hypothetical protein